MLIRALLILAFVVNPLAAGTGAGCGPARAEAAGGHSCCCGDACPDLHGGGDYVCGCAPDQDRSSPAPTPAVRGPLRDLALLPRLTWIVQVSAAPCNLAGAPGAAPRSATRPINSLVCVWLT